MHRKTSRPRLRDRFTVVLAGAGAIALVAGLFMIGTAGTAQADNSAVTCNALGFTKGVDEDKESGNETYSFGSLTWSGKTLTYNVMAGYTVELCIKSGEKTGGEGDDPPKITTFTVVGPSSGSRTIDQEISHIGYKFVTTTTSVAIPAALTPLDPCGSGNASWPSPLPAATGFTWSVNGAGQLIATTTSGLKFTDGNTMKNFGLPVETNTDPCPTVTAVAPTVAQSTQCEVQGTYTIPDTPGVRYLLNGQTIAPGVHTGPASGTITAAATGSAPLSNPAFSFALNVPAAVDCPDTARPVNPTVSLSDDCDVEGSYTIASTPGVRYLLDDVVVAAGTYSGPVAGTVTAQGVGGTVLTDPDWEFDLDVPAAEECEVAGSEGIDVCPNIAGEQTSVPDDFVLVGNACLEVLGEESERPDPKPEPRPDPEPDDEPTVKGVSEEIPTAVDAGIGGTTPTSSAGLIGQGLVGGGLVMLLLAVWMQRGRLSHGAHQV